LNRRESRSLEKAKHGLERTSWPSQRGFRNGTSAARTWPPCGTYRSDFRVDRAGRV